MTECPDQTARMRTLTRNFAVRIWHKGIFHTLRIIYDRNFPIVITKVKSQRMTKPSIRLVRPAKTQISLRIRADWSESLPVACAFYSLRAVQRGMNKNPLSLCWSHMSYCGFCRALAHNEREQQYFYYLPWQVKSKVDQILTRSF